MNSLLRSNLRNLIKKYIQVRDGNYCITCGKHCLKKEERISYYIPENRVETVLKYHPMNMNRQCGDCKDKKKKYDREMQKIHGKRKIKELDKLQNTPCKINYEKAIRFFQKEIKKQTFKEKPEVPNFCKIWKRKKQLKNQ